MPIQCVYRPIFQFAIMVVGIVGLLKTCITDHLPACLSKSEGSSGGSPGLSECGGLESLLVGSGV